MSDTISSNRHNLLYILTALQSIEQINDYSAGFDTFDEFLWANKRLNFNGSLQLLMISDCTRFTTVKLAICAQKFNRYLYLTGY